MPEISKAAELRRDRQKLHEDNAALLRAVEERWKADPPTGETAFVFDTAATPDERSTWEKRNDDFDALSAQIETLEKHDARGALVAADAVSRGRTTPTGGARDSSDPDPAETTEDERYWAMSPEARKNQDNEELRLWFLGGCSQQFFNEEQRMRHARRVVRRKFMEAHDPRSNPADRAAFIDGKARQIATRAQSVGTDSEGGYLVPEGFYNRLTEARLRFGGVRASGATVLTTATGQRLPMPTVDDTSNTGSIKAENVEVDETDVTFNEKALDAYLITSDLVRVSEEWFQDSAFDVGGLMIRLLGTRVNRYENTALTTGTGTSQHNGIVTASTEGKEAASATAITYLEMLDLKFSVDPEYWGSWMFNSVGTFKAIKKLLDGDSRPIFQPDVQTGRVDRIDGDPYTLNTAMASPAASQKVMLYGMMEDYFIREVLGMQFKRFDERFGEFLQLGFMAYVRSDGELLDAGVAPIKHYVMAA